MRRLFLVAVITALAWARPETYKETEDFQYSRSASDEGTKSGFYGAQRGNVGGNYERAHNMDSLAQHQMSGAVHQVEGELGDASKTRAGSVYTAANSRGIYGSGNFDLSNLEGRNFAESVSSDSSHSSLSSAYNQHLQNSGWRSHNQRITGSAASDQYGQSSLHSGSLQAGNSASSSNSHRLSNSENQHGFSSGYHSQSGYNSESRYQGESDSAYNQRLADYHLSSGHGAQTGDQTQSRYIVTPVRIYGRPGTQVAVPVFAQSSNTHRASAFDQNAINSEAEVLNNNQQHISTVPQNNAKHYESSYNYRKAWERRSESNPSSVPSVTPTVNPYPANSELYDEGQVASGQLNSLQQANSHSFSSGNAYNAQSSIAHSGSTQSRHQTDYSSQHKSDINSNAYLSGTHGSLTGDSIGTNVDSQPKSYQSSYAYHKSWERQGDPYVIVPETKTGVSSAQRRSSQYRQSNQHHSQGSTYDCDCDEYGNVRSKRSYNNFQYQEDLGQQAQTGWEENLGQQTQQSWGNFQQQTPDQLEDLGQQTQESWGNLQQHNKPEKLEDLGQQTQQSWGDLQQQSKPEKLEDLGQQTQQSWSDFQQQSKPEKLEDLGQQSQDWQELSQQAEKQLGQQTQQAWDQSEQHVNSQNLEEFGRHDDQQSQQTFSDLENLGQQSQSKWDFLDSSLLQKEHSLDQPDNIEQQNKPKSVEDLGQQTQKEWDNIQNLGQQVQTQWDDTNNINKTQHLDTINTEQQTQTHFLEGNQNKQDKEQIDDNWNTQHITGYTDSVRNNENTFFNKPTHPGYWGDINDNRHKTSFRNEHHSFNNLNSYLQSHGANWHEQVNRNTLQTSSHNPLQSLWDKIDNLEEQTILSANDKHNFSEEFTGYENSQHSYYAQGSTNHHERNSEETSNSYYNNKYEHNYSGSQATVTFNGIGSSNDKSKHNKSNSDDTFEKPKDRESKKELQPTDIGRGDISGEEESPTDVNFEKKEDDSQMYSTHIKNHEKTPDEIEALSLSIGTDKKNPENKNQEETLSVLSVSQQQWLEDQRQPEFDDFHKLRGSSTTTKPYINENVRKNPELSLKSDDNSQDRTSSNFFDHNKQQADTDSKNTFENTEVSNQKQKSNDFDQQTRNTDIEYSRPLGSQKENKNNYRHELGDLDQQQNTMQQLDDLDQKNQDLDQQNLEIFSNNRRNNDQHKTDQELEDFGQSQNRNQQNLQQFENLEHQSQHLGQQLEDFGQQTQNFNRQNLEPFSNLEHGKQDIDQKNTGKELDDLNQQHLPNFDYLEHHRQHSGQQLEDFNQQSQNLNQQNLVSFGNLDQNKQHIDQQNTGQELEDFGQQSQDLNQQNLQQFENYDHQNQHSGQQLEDFGQQRQDLNQQNLVVFGNLEHHKHKIDQQNSGQELDNFGHPTQNLNQENQQQFENMEHQSQHSGQQLEDFSHQNQDLNQQNAFSNLEHHKQNIDQQYTGQQLKDFGQKTEDLNQQSLQEFDNLDQQQSQNLEQANTWDQLGDLKPLSEIPVNVAKYDHQGREYDPKSNTQEIQEPTTNIEISKSQSVSKEEAPPQVTSTTEKPGFWKSVGNKLSSAKDSVASWFKRS